MTHYSVLGLQPGASLEEVKSAYRRLAMEFHPDRNPRGLERMKQINLAYEALKYAGTHMSTGVVNDWSWWDNPEPGSHPRAGMGKTVINRFGQKVRIVVGHSGRVYRHRESSFR